MHRLSLARRLGTATLLAALVATTAACGSEDSTATDESSSSSDSSEEAQQDAEDAEEAGDAEAGDLEELKADEFYPAIMSALQDAETMTFSITSASEAGDSEVAGVMRYNGGDGVDMSAAGTGDEPMKMVMLDKILYISAAGLGLPEGKSWVKVDMNDPNNPFAMLGKSTDPSAMYAAMETPKKFELIGTEDVDGVATNHYSVVMDTDAYVKAMEMPAQMTSVMPKEIDMEMWLDAANRPVKFRQQIELPSVTGGGEPAKAITEGTYGDFGDEIEIEAPPADEVSDKALGMG